MLTFLVLLKVPKFWSLCTMLESKGRADAVPSGTSHLHNTSTITGLPSTHAACVCTYDQHPPHAHVLASNLQFLGDKEALSTGPGIKSLKQEESCKIGQKAEGKEEWGLLLTGARRGRGGLARHCVV